MKEQLSAAAIVALAVGAYLNSASFSTEKSFSGMDPATYPRALAIVLIFLGAILLVSSFARSRRGQAAQAVHSGAPLLEELAVVAPVVGVLAAYVGAIYLFGFLLPTVLFTLSLSLLLKAKRSTALIICVPMAGVLYVVFFILFRVPIPHGILFG